MPFSAMWRRLGLVSSVDVSEESFASIFRVEKVSKLGNTLAVTIKRRLLQEPHGATFQKTQFFIVTAVKNFKSYVALTG
jgi:hypothetical protein